MATHHWRLWCPSLKATVTSKWMMSLTTLLKIWFSWNSDSQLQLFIDILCSWNDQCLGCNFMEINAMIWKDLGVNLSSPTRKRSAEEWSDNIGSVTVCDAHVYWFLVRSCRGCDQRDLSRAHSAATITIRKMVATDCRCQTSHCSLRLPRRLRLTEGLRRFNVPSCYYGTVSESQRVPSVQKNLHGNVNKYSSIALRQVHIH